MLYGQAFNSQRSNTNRLVGTATLNNIKHYSTEDGEVKMYSNVTSQHLRIINASMYYVILSSPVEEQGQYRGSIIHVEKMCVLLRAGAIKHAICSLPLAPNAQRANLTLTSNPLTRKRTNARRACSASDVTNTSSFFMHVYVGWQGIDESPRFFRRLPDLL